MLNVVDEEAPDDGYARIQQVAEHEHGVDEHVAPPLFPGIAPGGDEHGQIGVRRIVFFHGHDGWWIGNIAGTAERGEKFPEVHAVGSWLILSKISF